MVAASKRPSREILDIVTQINRTQSGGNAKSRSDTSMEHLETKIVRGSVDITPTEVYTLVNNGKLMATIHIKRKFAVFHHPAHYIYKRDFEDRLKPLVEYLFNNGYTLMSQQEYKDRTKSPNN